MSSPYRRSAQRVHWGERAIDQLPAELRRQRAERTLIVCGGSVGRHPRLVPRVLELIGACSVGVSADVRPHSPSDSVEGVAAMLASTRADSVVVIGGGSALVTARAACMLHGEARTLDSLATQQSNDGRLVTPRLLAPKLPIIAVPTTPTTATNKAGAAVTVTGRGDRLALFDPQTRARSVVLDPEHLDSSPVALVRQATLNAFVMAVEGVCAARFHLFSDAALMHAVRQFRDLLPALSAHTLSPGQRMDAALASLLVGEGTDSSGGGLTAALSHTVGHQYDAHNGEIDAVLLPHVLEHVPPSAAAARMIADGLGSAPGQMVAMIRQVLDGMT